MATHFDVLVIGSGFDGSLSALTIAREFQRRHHGGGPKKIVHMLERGTWWTRPVGTVQDPEIKTRDRLKEMQQPVQEWSAATGLKGVDPDGRVFDASKGPTAVYPGLYVVDAAVIPTALGVNPSLTISALALRFARKYVSRLGGA